MNLQQYIFLFVFVSFMENGSPLFIETVTKNNIIVTFLISLFKDKVIFLFFCFALALCRENGLFFVSKIQVAVHLNAKQRGWRSVVVAKEEMGCSLYFSE